MNHTNTILEFDKIQTTLSNYALTQWAKEKLNTIAPYLSEKELQHALRETTESRRMLDQYGMPPLVSLETMDEILMISSKGANLSPEQLETVASTLTAVRRLKDYLVRCKGMQLSLPFYEEQLDACADLQEEIMKKIRGGKVDDFASKLLRNIRQEIERIDGKMRMKAESMLKNHKECFSESFITLRNGRICLPVKKEHKFKINGSVLDKSSTGATLFIEPSSISSMYDELVNLRLDAENEERRILYELTELVHVHSEELQENNRVMEKLDYTFAKGKLSYDMHGIEPVIDTHRRIQIVNGRHPFLDQEKCIPLNFQLGDGKQGVVITGPNTGGKTVALKTVGLLSLMAQCGLHVPCEKGVFTMNNQILCDIGDGQNITENLSTFSAHITNVLSILKGINQESLVLMDELGTGTDPTEGMGIAIAILEELRKSGCLFLVTTHYPEVKNYAAKTDCIENARMAFDRESLKPLYKLEMGEAGESCAFYIAKRLGMPDSMLKVASMASYHKIMDDFKDSGSIIPENTIKPKVQKHKKMIIHPELTELYQIGDSVMIYPDKKIGIVCQKVNEKGVLQVQLQEKKIWINHKRVKLHVKSEELYPEDYDFSILFDSVAVRKARHQMGRKYCDDLEIQTEEPVMEDNSDK